MQNQLLESILHSVETPGQYVGGERNTVTKDLSAVDVKLALAFPDTYAIGMSHLGVQILYAILNGLDWVAAERVYAPWPDMEARMREREIPLSTLENMAPVRQFDVVGFSLQYEMCYTNVLNMLDLAGIPMRAEERTDQDPLVIAGGPGALSPEPLADFIDLFLLGDGEESVVKLVGAFREARRTGVSDRADLIRFLATRVSGAYAPSLFEVEYRDDGTVKQIQPSLPELATPILAEVVPDLESALAPLKPIVPFVQVVHDRITIEIMRGCSSGCRFCHAGMVKRPVRWRSPESILNLAEESYWATGHEEISLSSLSSSDYPGLADLVRQIAERFEPRKVNVSLPSLRVNDQLHVLPSLIGAVRKSGLTIAPEAASQRLRNVINKNIQNEHLFRGVEEAYRAGWRLVKLYFMVGLPTETEQDLEAIVDLAQEVSSLRRKVAKGRADVNVSIAPFVPKAHTPFQWEPMASTKRIEEAYGLLRGRSKWRSVRFKFHKIERSFLEGVFSRGDRRLGALVQEAWQRGARFDSWDEHFNFGVWLDAIEATGIDPNFYANRERGENEVLPWSHLSCGVTPEFLLEERRRAMQEVATENCTTHGCRRCGVKFCRSAE